MFLTKFYYFSTQPAKTVQSARAPLSKEEIEEIKKASKKRRNKENKKRMKDLGTQGKKTTGVEKKPVSGTEESLCGQIQSETSYNTTYAQHKASKRKLSQDARYVRYIIFLSILGSVRSHSLIGYDCNKILNHQLVPSPCLRQVSEIGKDRYDGWVAYHTRERIVSGLRCVTQVKLQSYYCGSSSHIHLLETPIVKTISLTPEECREVFKSKAITVYNKIYTVEPNTGLNHHGIIVNGSLTYGYTLGVFNVFCNPTGVQAANHFVDYGFKVGILSVSVTQVPLLLTADNIIDYQLDTKIGHWNNCTRGCTASTGSYYIPGDHSRYRLVKYLSFQKYTMGNQVFIVNHTENIHMEITEITITKVNNRQEQVLQTELPDVVLFTNPNMEGKIPKLHAQEARYDIAGYINTLYKYKQLQEELEHQVQVETCVRTHRIKVQPSTHYTRGEAITSLGELMRISTCTPVNITITEGRKDACYSEHISVQVNNITKIMLPGSRIVFDIADTKPVSCVKHPIFLYIGKNQYLGNEGSGMELIQVKKEVNHFKTHIFWSPLDDAIKDLTVMGEESPQNVKVTYLNELTGSDSITQTTADQVSNLESVFSWTFGKNFTAKFKSYFWSIILLIIIIALGCCIFCWVLKFACRRIYTYKFIPSKNEAYEMEQ